jgi:hypothetical protein
VDYLVFISHASKDCWIAKQMAAIIERKAKRYGVRTFLDEVDLVGGDRIPADQNQSPRLRGVRDLA